MVSGIHTKDAIEDKQAVNRILEALESTYTVDWSKVFNKMKKHGLKKYIAEKDSLRS